MTTIETAAQPGDSSTVHPRYTLAKIAAWYLLIAAAIRLAVWLLNDRTVLRNTVIHFVAILARGAGGFPAIQGTLWVVALVALLALGLIFVLTKVRAGARIVYGIYIALGFYSTFQMLVFGASFTDFREISYMDHFRSIGFGGDSGLFYFWLMVEVIGIALAIAAVIFTLSGIELDGAQRRGATTGAALLAGAGSPAGMRRPHIGTNVMAIVALVFGVGGSFLGVIFGHIALAQIERTGERGRKQALAGVILGYLGTAIVFTYLTFFFQISI
jgi:hypothetical protein